MSSNRAQHGKTVFQNKWLSEERFKLWLKPGKPGKKASEAICVICNNATINVEKMGLLPYSPMVKAKNINKCRLFFP